MHSPDVLTERWSAVLAAKANAPAVFSTRGEVLRTFADIDAEAKSIGGLPPGKVVAIQMGNSPSWPAVLLASLREGAVPLPLGRHIEAAERWLALETCGAARLIETHAGEITVTELEPGGVPSPECDFLKLTSGTTSAPRAVRFTAAQLVADCDNVCDTMGITDADVNFGVIPFSHSYGFSNLLTPLLCRGVPLIASEDRMPRAMLDDLARTGATVFPGMPVFYQAFGEMNPVPKLPALRLCISAGAPLGARVAGRFTGKFGLKIHTFYGSSECGGIGYDRSDAPEYEEGFAGQPLQNVAIRARSDGTIEVRSAAVGLGYFPDPDPALGSGRFVPSDIVRQTERGMFLAGRVSDVINVAGRKLNPGEVEAQLMRFEGVDQAVVFGVPSALRHEEPVVCIASKNPAFSAQALLQFCHSTLSAWQVPKDVWMLPEIPANERGKVSRRELARRYVEAHPGGVSR